MKKKIERYIRKKERERVLKLLKENMGIILGVLALLVALIVFKIVKKKAKKKVKAKIKASVKSGIENMRSRDEVSRRDG